MLEALGCDLGFLGYIGEAFVRMMSDEERMQVIFSVLAAVDKRNDMIALPRFACRDFPAATTLTAAGVAIKDTQTHAGRNGSVGRGGPLRQRSRAHFCTARKKLCAGTSSALAKANTSDSNTLWRPTSMLAIEPRETLSLSAKICCVMDLRRRAAATASPNST